MTENATSRGRPSEGVRIDIRIPADVLAAIDTEARSHGVTRATVIRNALRYLWQRW